MKIRWMYTTTPSKESAKNIASALLSKKLIACANLLPTMESLYEWKGEVQQDNECVLICKTTKDRTEEVIQEIKNHHEFECPCIISLPVKEGEPEFLKWIHSETHKEGGKS